MTVGQQSSLYAHSQLTIQDQSLGERRFRIAKHTSRTKQDCVLQGASVESGLEEKHRSDVEFQE
jgi:hypothetical protein